MQQRIADFSADHHVRRQPPHESEPKQPPIPITPSAPAPAPTVQQIEPLGAAAACDGLLGELRRGQRRRQGRIHRPAREAAMIRIAITPAAYDAIAATLPLGRVGYENKTNEGERLIWLDRAVVDRLRAIRGPGESFSDVILWFVAAEG
jgi:hypothetical protein